MCYGKSRNKGYSNSIQIDKYTTLSNKAVTCFALRKEIKLDVVTIVFTEMITIHFIDQKNELKIISPYEILNDFILHQYIILKN